MTQMSLFNPNRYPKEEMIPGIMYSKEYTSDADSNELISEIDKNEWLPDLTRRVQHYGYKYNYKGKKVDTLGGYDNFPVWLKALHTRLNKTFHLNFNSCIINEYKSQQGISRHIDAPCFDNHILTLSLIEDDEIEFSRSYPVKDKKILILNKNSVLIIYSEARWGWKHSIRPKDRQDRRISITFRTVKNV